MSALHKNIREFRIMRRITQKDFAAMLSKSRNVISNWERGANSPDPDTIEEICRILDVTPNMIFGWDPCPEYEARLQRMSEYGKRIDELQKQRKELDAEIEKLHQKINEEQ